MGTSWDGREVTVEVKENEKTEQHRRPQFVGIVVYYLSPEA